MIVRTGKPVILEAVRSWSFGFQTQIRTVDPNLSSGHSVNQSDDHPLYVLGKCLKPHSLEAVLLSLAVDGQGE